MMFVEGRLTRPDRSEADVAGSRRQGRRRQGGGLAAILDCDCLPRCWKFRPGRENGVSAEPENCE